MGSSTGSLLVADDAGLRAVLKVIRRRASFHAEDEPRLNERKNLRVEGDPRSHPVWRDETAALKATQRLVTIAHETGARVHVLHVSTAQEMEYLAGHKDVASVETTPHHLTLEAPGCYERLGTRAQMNPPVRDAAHRAGIWSGIAQGVVDVLGSDHAPHTREEKAKTYPASPSGMTGVQTLVPDHARSRQCRAAVAAALRRSHQRRARRVCSASPRKGRIAAGYDADLTVVDLKRRETITDKWMASRAGWTPYDGVSVTGWPVGTFVRGRKVMWEGALATPAQGERVQISGNACELRDVEPLLPRLLEREFTVADARAQAIGERRGGFFAIGGHEFGERGEQARLRKAVAVNAVVARFRPGFVEVAECHHFLFAVGNRLARVNRILGNRS